MNVAGIDIHRLGEKRRFRVIEAACIGYSCFEAAVLVDEKKREVPTCLTRSRCCCPHPSNRGFDELLVDKRTRDGWRIDE